MAFSKASTDWEGSRIDCQVSEGTMGEFSTIVERWFVSRKRATSDFSAANLPYDFETMRAQTTGGGPVIPRIGAGYPTGTGNTWQDTAALRSITYSPSGKGFIVTLTYSTMYFYATNAKGLAPSAETLGSATNLAANSFLQAKVIPTVRTRSTLAYRSQSSGGWVPSPTTDASASDIGGVALGAGRGQQIDIRQVALKLRLIIDNEVTGQNVDAVTGIIQAYSGKRNSAPFLGYGTGTLVCEGGALNHIQHEYYEFVLDYLWDEWAHKDQIPETGADGRPLMTGSAPSDVRFRRITRDSVNFNDIWPASDQGLSYKFQAFKGVWY